MLTPCGTFHFTRVIMLMLNILWAMFISVSSYSMKDVFTDGLDGYACYRIPALLDLGNSSYLLFAEGRYYGCSDHGFVDLVVKESHDAGMTWGPLRVVYSESKKGKKNVTIGNPAPVFLSSGTILLPFCRENLGAGVLRSRDHGATWEYYVNLTVLSDWTWIATGPPGSLQLPSERILIPANHVSSGKAFAHAYISDDLGETWSLSSFIPDGNEDQAVSLPWLGKDAVLMSMRTPAAVRNNALSLDGGKTWGPPWSVIKEGPCEASTIALPHHPAGPTLVMSSPLDLSSRDNLTISVSRDEGKHWSSSILVYHGKAAYSSLIPTGLQSVALAFERDGYKSISFINSISIE